MNIIRAMLWELWRTSRWELLMRVLGTTAIVLFICAVAKDMDGAQADAIRGIMLVVLLASSVFSATWLTQLESRNTGFSFRLGFTRPVSTRLLVAVPIAFSVVVSILCFALPAWLFTLISGVSLPMVGPCCLAAALVSTGIATLWSPSTRLGKTWALIAWLVGLAVALGGLVGYRQGKTPIL